MGQTLCGHDEDGDGPASLFSRTNREKLSPPVRGSPGRRLRRRVRRRWRGDDDEGRPREPAPATDEDVSDDDDDGGGSGSSDETAPGAGKVTVEEFNEIVGAAVRLDDGEKRVLRASWQVINVDRTAVGTQFILLLFRTYPDYLSLFQALAALDDESLSGSSALHSHAMTFMHSLAGVVESLDDVDVLVAQLNKIADRHRPFGLTKEDFANLFSASLFFSCPINELQKATAVFLKVLKTVEGLEGLEYDRKTIMAAWQKAIGTIVAVIGNTLPVAEEDEQQ